MPILKQYLSNPDLVLQEKNTRLVRLKYDMIEILRNWRNDPDISQYMISQDYITKENQKDWFKKVEKSKDCFEFVLFDKDIPVGRCSIINIKKDIKEAELGILIGNKKYLNSGYVAKAYILLFDFIFFNLQLETLIGRVRQENVRASRFNSMFGYKQITAENGLNIYHTLKKDYINNREQLYKFCFCN